jgi:NAD(P)-dependent dehydrogenase (short-subunit alcohol dehydrogenase family)
VSFDFSGRCVLVTGDTIMARTPLACWGVPEDLVGPALFLCSDHPRFVTSAVLPVDGGYLAV